MKFHYLSLLFPSGKLINQNARLFALAAALLGATACTRTENTTETEVAANTAETDTTASREYEDENVAGPVGSDQVVWNNVDFNIMQDRFDEIGDRDISVATNQQLAVYSINEPVIFDAENPAIRKEAEQKLRQISTSISQRYPNYVIRIFGYGKAAGGNQNTQALAQQRAEAVRNWLVSNGGLNEARITVHSDTTNQPNFGNTMAANSTDRKVVIAVYRGESSQSEGAAKKPAEASTGQDARGIHNQPGTH